MSLKNASLLIGATMTPSGGSAVALGDYGLTKEGHIDLAVPADSDFRTRRHVYVKVTPPSPNSKSIDGYTQRKCEMTVKLPKTLASGKITNLTAKVSIWASIENTDAEIQTALSWVAQLVTDSDITPTFTTLQTN